MSGKWSQSFAAPEAVILPIRKELTELHSKHKKEALKSERVFCQKHLALEYGSNPSKYPKRQVISDRLDIEIGVVRRALTRRPKLLGLPTMRILRKIADFLGVRFPSNKERSDFKKLCLIRGIVPALSSHRAKLGEPVHVDLSSPEKLKELSEVINAVSGCGLRSMLDTVAFNELVFKAYQGSDVDCFSIITTAFDWVYLRALMPGFISRIILESNNKDAIREQIHVLDEVYDSLEQAIDQVGKGPPTTKKQLKPILEHMTLTLPGIDEGDVEGALGVLDRSDINPSCPSRDFAVIDSLLSHPSFKEEVVDLLSQPTALSSIYSNLN